MFGNHKMACKGWSENGALIVPRYTLCSCDCHGDYEKRLIEAGQSKTVEDTEDELELEF
jgi:hypothetical protein